MSKNIAYKFKQQRVESKVYTLASLNKPDVHYFEMAPELEEQSKDSESVSSSFRSSMITSNVFSYAHDVKCDY